jgi:hypothetical protein
MIGSLARILVGYAIAVTAASATLLVELPLLLGGPWLSWVDSLGATAMLGVFAGGGLIFAILAERRSWTKLTTFIGGGAIATATGVAALAGLSILQAGLQGYMDMTAENLASFLNNMAQLLALGLAPGLVGGAAYWAAAIWPWRDR